MAKCAGCGVRGAGLNLSHFALRTSHFARFSFWIQIDRLRPGAQLRSPFRRIIGQPQRPPPGIEDQANRAAGRLDCHRPPVAGAEVKASRGLGVQLGFGFWGQLGTTEVPETERTLLVPTISELYGVGKTGLTWLPVPLCSKA